MLDHQLTRPRNIPSGKNDGEPNGVVGITFAEEGMKKIAQQESADAGEDAETITDHDEQCFPESGTGSPRGFRSRPSHPGMLAARR